LLNSGTTWSGTVTGSAINFTSTLWGNTITTNGVKLGVQQVEFMGVGGNWTLGSSITIGLYGIAAGSIYFTNGTFDTSPNSYSIDAYSFGLSTGTKTINLNNSTMTIGGTNGGIWNISAPVILNTKFNTGTSTIVLSGSFSSFGGGFNFYNVNFSSTAYSQATITGNNTFNNLTISSRGSGLAGLNNFSFDSDQRINGTLTFTSPIDSTYRQCLKSDTIGTPRTLTINAISGLTDIDFRDIKIAGAVGTISGTRLSDCGGNSGITFSAAKTVYFIGTTFSSSGWATSSGGTTSFANYPLAQDTIIIDDNSVASGTTIIISYTTGQNIGTLDFRNRTLSLGLIIFNSSHNVYGSYYMPTVSATYANGGDPTFCGRGIQNFSAPNVVSGTWNNLFISSPNTTLKILGNTSISAINGVQLVQGTFDLNGYTFTMGGFGSTGTTTRTLNFNNGKIVVAGSSWNTVTSTGLTILGSGTISMTAAYAKGITTGQTDYSNITLSQDGAGTLTVTGTTGYKIGKITNTVSPTTILFQSSTTHSIGNLSLNGTSSNLVTIGPTSAATVYTLKSETGWAHKCSYCSVSYMTGTTTATDGQTVAWRFAFSTNTAGNTNLTFVTTYFWVGGTGTWDAVTTTNWSLTSGGAGSTGPPTAADNVIFDSNSGTGTVTFSGAPVGYDVTIGGTGITIAGAVQVPFSGSCTILASTTWSYSSTITMNAVTKGHLINTNGVTLSNSLILNGSNGGWSLGSALNLGFSGLRAFTINQGTFNTNNYNITAGTLTVGSSGTSIVSATYFGSSTLTFSNVTGSVFTFNIHNNTIFDSGTSTIISGSAGAYFTLNYRPIKFYNVSIQTTSNNNQGFYDGSSSNQSDIGGVSYTFNNLTITSTAGSAVNLLLIDNNITVNGTLTFVGNSITQRQMLWSRTYGKIQLYANTIVGLSDIDFRDIVATGPATWSGTRLGDCGGNSGITFNAPKTVYYSETVSSSGSNITTTKWATTSGGTGNTNNFPLAQDTIVIDNNSTTSSGTFTLYSNFSYKKIIISNRTNPLTLQTNYNIFSDDFIIPSSITLTGGGITIHSTYGLRLNFSVNPVTDTSGYIYLTGLGSVKLTNNCTFKTIGVSGGVSLELNDYNLNVFNVELSGQTGGFLTLAPSAYRTIDFASTSVINVSGNNSVVWNESTSYGPSTKSALRVKGNSVVNFTYSGSTGTRTINTALPALSYNSIFDDYTIESNCFNFNITAGTDIVDLSSSGFFVRSLNFTGFSGTLTRQTSGNCFINGNLTLSSGMTFTGFTGVNTYFNATQGTQIITSNGKTFLGPGSINIGSVATKGLGLATVQLIDNFTTDNAINNLSLNQGILDLNNNTLTCPTFSCINLSTTYKAINFRTSGQINLNSAASANVSIWLGNSGSFYIYGTPTVNVTDAGTATFTRTINTTNSINPINFNIQAGVAGSIFSFSGSYGNLNFTGCSSTINNSALTILGSVNLGSTATFTAGASAWTFAPRKLETFTSNTITVDWPITINATEVNSGTLQLQDNTTIGATRTLTLTQGVLDLNSKTLNVGLFVSNNSNVRTVAFGASGIMNITATTTSTVFDTTTTSNSITVTGSRTVNISGAAASGITRTINPTNLSGFSAGYFDINLTGGAAGSTITFVSGYVRNLNFTGTLSTITQVGLNFYGNLNLGSTATFTAGANSWVFTPPGGTTTTITTNAKTVDWPILLSGTGTLALQDSLTMGTTRAFTINVGVLNLNGFTLTAATMSVLSQGTNPAGTNNVIGSSPSQIVLTGTGAVWNWGALTGTVISVPPILLTDTSTTARTMTMGGSGVNYQKITIGGTTGISTTTISGACYVGEWASTKTVAHTILFSLSSSINFDKWSITGTAGNVVTIGPVTAPTLFYFVPSSRVTGVNYLSISYCGVSPFVVSGGSTVAGAEFYAGANSTDGGGNTRFIYFTAAPTATTRYWVGGTGTWDATTTTNWSTSSGGSGGASVPTSVDNVIFDSASSSGNYTVSRGATAIQTMVNDLTISAPASGTLTFGSGGIASLTIFGSLSIAATGVTLSLSSTTVAFLATTTGKTITTNGLSGFGNPVNFFGVGGEWTLGSSFSVGGTGTLYLNAGSLITANYNVTAAALNSISYLPRSINLGSSTVTFSGLAGTILPVNSDSNLTWNAGTSSIILNTSGNSQTIIDAASTPLGLTFYNFTYNISAVGGLAFNGSYTFNNLTIGSGRPTGVVSLIFYANQTINGTLTLQTPTNGNARTIIYGYNSSLLTGTQRTLTINAVANMTDVDFRDIKIAGAVGTLTGTRIGNCTNNSGITFNTPKIVYCTSSVNQWQSNCWSTTPSGTPSYDNFPLAQDTIRFDNAANISDGPGSPYHLGTIDLSTRNGSFSLSITGGSMLIYGNVILNNSTTLNTNSLYGMFFLGNNNQTFTSSGSILILNSGGSITINKSNNSSFILGDAMNALCSVVSSSSGGISLTQGILDLNGYNLTITTFDSTNSNTRSIKFNGAAIFCTGGGSGSTQSIWNTTTATNLTFSGKPNVYFTYRGPQNGGSRSIVHGSNGMDYNHLPNFYITGGTDLLSMWPAIYYAGDVDFTGFSGKLDTIVSGASIAGNLTFSPNMTVLSSTNALNFVGPRQKTIKTNGQVLDIPLTINFASTYANIINPPSLTLLDNLTLGPTSNGNFSITGGSGNFYANNFNVTSNTLNIGSVSQNYFVDWGNGNWTVTGSTVILNGFGAIGTSYPGNATIFMTSTNTKTLTGPGAAIVQLPKICQAGNGTLSITGNAGQFNDIFANTFPSIITLGSAISCNNFTLSGRAGALVTLNSSVAATGRAITKVGGGTVSTNYLSIQDSLPVATGTSWYAGPNSTRVSNFGVWSAANAPNSNIIDII
jgi:hypothetical protein